MSEIVFILGAGASREANIPLIPEFLDVAQELGRSEKLREHKEHFERVFQAIGTLQNVHSKSQLDINNVESVFASFEMARVLGRFGDYTVDQIEQIVTSLKIVISKTIEERLQLTYGHTGYQIPPPYDRFVKLIMALETHETIPRVVSILSFNYDLALDFAMHRSGIGIDYGLGSPSSGNPIPVLKLHGSLNWGQCSKCEEIIPWHFGDFEKNRPSPRPDSRTKTITLELGSKIDELRHCDRSVSKQPFIVPPTWNKTEYHRSIAPVWRAAAKELSEASSIFVIGFSLTPSDSFFRYLYALGTVGNVPLKHFWAINPSNDGDIEKRYRDLLGPGALARFRYEPVTFSKGIDLINKEFN